MMSSHFASRLSVVLCYTLSLITPSEAMACNGSATYKLTFKAEWTAQSHPQDFPNGAHFSQLVGCTHNPSYVMWKPGMKATEGVKVVAETGNPDKLNSEIDKQISSKTALAKFLASGIGSGVGTTSTSDVQVSTQYPLVSAISMIAPSPDWFVGVHDYSLCNQTTGKWVDKWVKDLFLYDAGTDSAPRFVHTGTPTIPPVPIFLITNNTEGSLKSNNTIKRFGTFTFEKTSEDIPTDNETKTPISTTPTKPNAAIPVGYINVLSFLKLITTSLLVSFHLI